MKVGGAFFIDKMSPSWREYPGYAGGREDFSRHTERSRSVPAALSADGLFFLLDQKEPKNHRKINDLYFACCTPCAIRTSLRNFRSTRNFAEQNPRTIRFIEVIPAKAGISYVNNQESPTEMLGLFIMV